MPHRHSPGGVCPPREGPISVPWWLKLGLSLQVPSWLRWVVLEREGLRNGGGRGGGGQLWALAAEDSLQCLDGRLVSTHTLRDAPEMLGGSQTGQLHPRGHAGQLRPGRPSEGQSWGKVRPPREPPSGGHGGATEGTGSGAALFAAAGGRVPSLSESHFLSKEELGLSVLCLFFMKHSAFMLHRLNSSAVLV